MGINFNHVMSILGIDKSIRQIIYTRQIDKKVIQSTVLSKITYLKLRRVNSESFPAAQRRLAGEPKSSRIFFYLAAYM